MTSVEICNLALSRLGEYKITTLGDAIPAAEKCSAAYGPARDALLERHRWNFARGSKNLTPTWVTMTSISDAGGLVNVEKVAHGRSTGDRVTVKDTSTDGSWIITVVDDDNFTLDDSEYVDTTAGSYTLAPPFGYAYRFAWPSDCLFIRMVNGQEAQRATASYQVEGREIFINTDTVSLVYTKSVTDTTLFPNVFIDCLALRLGADLAMPITGSMERRTALLSELVQIALPNAIYNNAIEPKAQIINREMDSPSIRARTFSTYVGGNVGIEPPTL